VTLYKAKNEKRYPANEISPADENRQ